MHIIYTRSSDNYPRIRKVERIPAVPNEHVASRPELRVGSPRRPDHGRQETLDGQTITNGRTRYKRRNSGLFLSQEGRNVVRREGISLWALQQLLASPRPPSAR